MGQALRLLYVLLGIQYWWIIIAWRDRPLSLKVPPLHSCLSLQRSMILSCFLSLLTHLDASRTSKRAISSSEVSLHMQSCYIHYVIFHLERINHNNGLQAKVNVEITKDSSQAFSILSKYRIPSCFRLFSFSNIKSWLQQERKKMASMSLSRKYQSQNNDAHLSRRLTIRN